MGRFPARSRRWVRASLHRPARIVVPLCVCVPPSEPGNIDPTRSFDDGISCSPAIRPQTSPLPYLAAPPPSYACVHELELRAFAFCAKNGPILVHDIGSTLRGHPTRWTRK
jgi:hypothetical protein